MASAAILTGGQASRFGGIDKSPLMIGDASILIHQLREFGKVANEILLVGATLAAAPGEGFRVVPDRYPGYGPLGGLDAALAAARDEVVLLVACDMPFVTAPLVAYPVGLVGEAQAAVPRTKHGYHPLCAAYSRTCREAVADHLAARRLSMVGLLEDVNVRIVERSEIERFGAADRLLANVNTPAEFHAIEAHLDRQV